MPEESPATSSSEPNRLLVPASVAATSTASTDVSEVRKPATGTSATVGADVGDGVTGGGGTVVEAVAAELGDAAAELKFDRPGETVAEDAPHPATMAAAATRARSHGRGPGRRLMPIVELWQVALVGLPSQHRGLRVPPDRRLHLQVGRSSTRR